MILTCLSLNILHLILDWGQLTPLLPAYIDPPPLPAYIDPPLFAVHYLLRVKKHMTIRTVKSSTKEAARTSGTT